MHKSPCIRLMKLACSISIRFPGLNAKNPYPDGPQFLSNEPLQESNQVRQPVQSKKERVEDYQPESSLTESFMNLVDFVQPAKIFFEDVISGR